MLKKLLCYIYQNIRLFSNGESISLYIRITAINTPNIIEGFLKTLELILEIYLFHKYFFLFKGIHINNNVQGRWNELFSCKARKTSPFINPRC